MGLAGKQLELPAVEPSPGSAAADRFERSCLDVELCAAMRADFKRGFSAVDVSLRYGVPVDVVVALLVRDDLMRKWL